MRSKSFYTKRFIKILFTFFVFSSILTLDVNAQCTGGYFQTASQKVYRQTKMYLEGVADLTGDGKLDAYGYQLQPNNTYQNLVVVPGDGAGGFADNAVVSNTAFPISSGTEANFGASRTLGGVTVGDLNADGKPDFVVRGQTAPAAVFSFINNGSGSLTAQGAATALQNNEWVLQIADLNNDGRGDLLTSLTQNGYLNTISYRLGNADGTFAAAVQVSNAQIVSPLAADFDADGKIDIAFTFYNSSSTGGDNSYHLRVLQNLGNGIFNAGTSTLQNMDAHLLADFNADGKPDIGGLGAGGFIVLINAGNNTFTRNVNALRELPPSTIYYNNKYFLTDYNGDGKKDILIDYMNADTPYGARKIYHSVLLNDGAANFTRVDFATPYLGIPANLGGDAKDEKIIFANATTGSPLPSVTRDTVITVKQNLCQPPARTQTKILDFDGDELSDIALWRPSTGVWQHYSSGSEVKSFNWGQGASGDKPAPGDFDGDGLTDRSVYRNGEGVWYILRSSDSVFVAVQFGSPNDVPVPADYNGGGRTDIAVYRPSLGDWYVLYSENQQFYGTHFGIAEDKPMPADYDGDGKHDVAVFRPSNGTWYVLRSSDSGFTAQQWGEFTDIPVAADFDTDGKADLAVYRRSSGTWYILESFDGGYTFYQYGWSGDYPMAVDSNGDGVMELGLYRPQAGLFSFNWYASGRADLFGGTSIGSSGEVPIKFLTQTTNTN